MMGAVAIFTVGSAIQAGAINIAMLFVGMSDWVLFLEYLTNRIQEGQLLDLLWVCLRWSFHCTFQRYPNPMFVVVW